MAMVRIPRDRHGAALLAHIVRRSCSTSTHAAFTCPANPGGTHGVFPGVLPFEAFHGVAPSSGFAIPRLEELQPDYIPNTRVRRTPTSTTRISRLTTIFYNPDPLLQVNARPDRGCGAGEQAAFVYITRYDDYREVYFIEGFHCAFEPQGQDVFSLRRAGHARGCQ